MNEIKVFENKDFGRMRTIDIDGEMWFVGKDVAEALGYSNASKAVITHVDNDDKQFVMIDIADSQNGNVPLGQSKTTIINESGLYSLILSSKLPAAKEFKRWVTSEVLPSIRKHGAYMTPETLEAAVLNPDYLMKIAQALKDEQEKRKELEARNKQLKDTNDILVKDIADCDYRALINNLVRSYAGNVCNNQFGTAFRLFYRRLYAKYGICLGKRKSAVEGSKEPLISFLKDTEIGNAARVALAMCEESGINAGEVIGNTNLQKICEVAK